MCTCFPACVNPGALCPEESVRRREKNSVLLTVGGYKDPSEKKFPAQWWSNRIDLLSRKGQPSWLIISQLRGQISFNVQVVCSFNVSYTALGSTEETLRRRSQSCSDKGP